MVQKLLFVSPDRDAVRSEIETLHGRVIHHLSANLVVVEVPEDFDTSVLIHSSPVSDDASSAAARGDQDGMQRAIRAQASGMAARLADTVDESTRAALAAWHYKLAESSKVSPTEGLSWGDPEHQAPINDVDPDAPPSRKK